MNIKIITTEKKLTASLVNQMPATSFEDMARVVAAPDAILGHVRTTKGTFALMHNSFDYCKLNIDKGWVPSKAKPTNCNSSSGGWFKEFDTEASRDRFIEMYNIISEQAKLTHIYM
jgi:hypothetical protein